MILILVKQTGSIQISGKKGSNMGGWENTSVFVKVSLLKEQVRMW